MQWQSRAHFFGAAAQLMLRFFDALSHDEAAQVLNVSVTTVRLDWSLGQAGLDCELTHRKAP